MFRLTGIAGLFVLLTGIMTWPQPLVLATHATDHQDVFFNLWRLRWIAHSFSTAPLSLFDGNIFYPERGVLAYSDAMLFEGTIAAPLLWAGVPPVLVHNLMLLGAIVASGTGAFVLARHVCGSATAAVVAGVVFAFAPYRFEHYMHMELQWTVWIPWTFWALQRTIETGSIRFGVMTGVFAGLQTLSSIYYGLFLALLLLVVGGAQLLPRRGRPWLMAVKALTLAAVIAGAVAWGYSRPYSRAAARVGPRGAGEVRMFSARPQDYRVATETNFLYGKEQVGRPERRLFPGILPALLALVGLLLVPPSVAVVAYLIGAVAAFELSLGMHGRVYPYLYEHVTAFQGLRAPARASVFCLLFLGVLAAQGCAALGQYLQVRGRQALAAAACLVLLMEYWVAPLRLVPYENEAPPLYAWLALQPRGVVAEFPMPKGAPPHHDPRFAYMSTFHWKPLVNGYSGYYPPSYLRRMARVEEFPDPESLRALRADGVRYLIVHSDGYRPRQYERVLEELVATGLPVAGQMPDGYGNATVFILR